MKILFISQYYPPEVCAPSARVSELTKYWQRDGNTVTVITGMPNHPDGIIHPRYKWEYFKEEWVNGVRVLRVILYVTPNKGFQKRIISFLSFMITSFITGLFVVKPDVVIVTSPQLFLGLTGYMVSRFRKIPFVFEVRDIWPQSAIDLKIIKSRFIIKFMEIFERFLYSKADLIIVVTPMQKINVKMKCNKKKKVECIPNGIDPEIFDVKDEKKILWKDGVKKGFTVICIGTIGLSHNLEILVRAAQKMKNKNIYFFIVGDGAQREKIENSIKEKKLENIFVYDKIPKTDVPYALKESDVGFSHLRDLPMAREMYPAKMFDIMAAGKPLLIGIHGGAKDLIEKNKTGIVFKSDSVEDLVKNLEILIANPNLCEEYGKNGIKLVNEKFNRKVQAKDYMRFIKEVSTKGKNSNMRN
ncbi:MAG: hypothetical protein COX48_00095 [bacterium (Candidatus Stahlbacteria) CG23_combo_of_CG06-09_8_20_14_all_34_7]|nr:MAG: hypothetical protein COX48_00095 [bacterium (Candidatus Stahlbacteria) CG23_combo_of_CG06-09_8_20_14_all_34_7]